MWWAWAIPSAFLAASPLVFPSECRRDSSRMELEIPQQLGQAFSPLAVTAFVCAARLAVAESG
jgi:hypothetical protein